MYGWMIPVMIILLISGFIIALIYSIIYEDNKITKKQSECSHHNGIYFRNENVCLDAKQIQIGN